MSQFQMNRPIEKLAAKLPQLRKTLEKARKAHTAAPSLPTYLQLAQALMDLGNTFSEISTLAVLELVGLDGLLRDTTAQRNAAPLQDKVNPPAQPATTSQTVQ